VPNPGGPNLGGGGGGSSGSAPSSSSAGDGWIAAFLPSVVLVATVENGVVHWHRAVVTTGGRTELHSRSQRSANLIAAIMSPAAARVALPNTASRSLALALLLGSISLALVALVEWWRRRLGLGYERLRFWRRDRSASASRGT
jgi:hypothetical protein